MTKPNFFIVGAAKCGTTAMFQYLRQHPDIHMSDPKEPQFFGKDLNLRSGYLADVKRRQDWQTYESFFDGGKGERRIGESSTWYLFSTEAAQEIKDYAPEARIIIMLRRPVQMMYSLYYQNVFNTNEDLDTFTAALDAEQDRKAGRRIPETTFFVEPLLYREAARFTDQVRRYFEAFGREQVHVIIHDDLNADTPGVYRDTLRFLDVDPEFTVDFRVFNPNKRFRSQRLRFILRHKPAWMRAVGRTVVPGHYRQKVSRKVNKMLLAVNTEYMQRPPLDPDLRQQLQAEFAPEIDRLSELLGRDLSHWYREQRS
jgi:hypothetical protein